jgi:hypothetical protein
MCDVPDAGLGARVVLQADLHRLEERFLLGHLPAYWDRSGTSATMRRTHQPADAMHYRHVIITRFNVLFRELAHKRVEGKGLDASWLAERFDLFERYCLPSVLAQTSQDFIWLIYFNAATPPEFVERARRACAGRDNIRLMFCDVYDHALLERDLRAELTPEPEWLLTTRLDNDDGLRCDFIKRVHENLRFSGAEALNFTNGIIYAAGKTYLHRDESNAFLSLLEPFEGFKTVLFVRHPDMARLAPVRQIAGEPAWLQVIHDSNIRNRVRGWRVSVGTALEGFAIAGEAAPLRRDSTLTLLMDNLAYGVWRMAWDRFIEMAKSLRRAATSSRRKGS